MSTLKEHLESDLRSFFSRHDPSKLDKKFIATFVNLGLTAGTDAINGALFRKYGCDLNTGLAPANPAASQVRNSRVQRKGRAQSVPKGSQPQENRRSLNRSQPVAPIKAGMQDLDNTLAVALDKDKLRHEIELFYLKHDPSKLDKPEDMESVIQWTEIYGKQKLNEKLKAKYSEDLSSVTEEDAVKVIENYYKQLGEDKTRKDFLALVEWGMNNSFWLLNVRLMRKYGKGFSDFDKDKQEAVLKQNLTAFYNVHDKKQLEDEENIKFILKWTAKHGERKLNERLQQKYKANLNTILRAPPPGAVSSPPPAAVASPPPAAVASPPQGTVSSPPPGAATSPPQGTKIGPRPPAGPPPSRGRQSSVGEKSIGLGSIHESDDGDVKNALASDSDRLEHLRSMASYFYAKHNTDMLYNGGVAEVLQVMQKHGEQDTNETLKDEYGEDLADIEMAYNEIKEKLTLFYKIYDEAKLSQSIESVVGWGIVHGKQLLNEKLMAKYDDDLECNGLKKRLRLFYKRVKENRSDKEIDDIAKWAFTKGLTKLNNQMKKKYGISLEDLFLTDEAANEFAEPESDDDRAEHEDFGMSTHSIHTYQDSVLDKGLLNKNGTLRSGAVPPPASIQFDRRPPPGPPPQMHMEEVVQIQPGTTFGPDTTDSGNEIYTERQKIQMQQQAEQVKPVAIGNNNGRFKPQPPSAPNHTLHIVDSSLGQNANPGLQSPAMKVNEDFGVDEDDDNENDFSSQVSAAPSKLARFLQNVNQHEETQRKLQQDLTNKLVRFYQKHDPSKVKNGKISENLKYVSEHGVDKLNELLMEDYGESLKSLEFSNRKQTFINHKRLSQLQNAPGRMSNVGAGGRINGMSHQDFMQMNREQLEQVTGVIEEL